MHDVSVIFCHFPTLFADVIKTFADVIKTFDTTSQTRAIHSVVLLNGLIGHNMTNAQEISIFYQFSF